MTERLREMGRESESERERERERESRRVIWGEGPVLLTAVCLGPLIGVVHTLATYQTYEQRD